MVFNVGGDEVRVQRYEAVWKKVEELLGERLTGEPLISGKYVNPKLITWDSRIRTAFRGTSPEPRDIGSCLFIFLFIYFRIFIQDGNFSF